MPTAEPLAIPPSNLSQPATPCPCGRTDSLHECCLPVAQRLRSGPAQHTGPGAQPTPFDEIRASCALLLWSLLTQEIPGLALRQSLSSAAREFWGVALSESPSGTSCEDPAGLAAPLAAGPDVPHADTAYADALFERTWGAVDAGTLTWVLGTLPAYARADPLVAELALDWLLWDKAWLRGHPACSWLLQTPSFAGRARAQKTGEALLRSRVGLWRLEEALPGRGFLLADRLSGAQTPLHTTSDPWPDPERLLLARVYSFGRWRLLAGRCLLLDPEEASELILALRHRARAVGAPDRDDPRWLGWLKAEMIPMAINRWLGSRLALPCPGRYHGTHC